MCAHSERDDRVRRRRFLIGEVPQHAGVVADPGEADRRPADEREHRGGRDSHERCASAPGERKPHRQRPQEELEDDRDPRCRARGQRAVAPVPGRRDGEQQQRLDRPEVDRAPRAEKDAGERVAAPVAELE